MSNSIIGALRVMLGMDTSEFEDGADRTERTTRRMERNFAQLGDRMQKIGAGLTRAISVPLMGIAAAGAAAANQLAQDSERMRLAAQTAGVGFEEFQRGAYAALAGAGIESEKFADILKDTSDKIGDFAATGGGELAGFFQTVAAAQGLTVDDFLGKGSIEQLRLFVSTLEKAGVPSEQMVFYLESIADEGSALLPILRDNGAALDQLGQKAAIIDPQTVAELKEYTAAQKELDTATRRLTIALVKSGLIEGMTQLVEGVANFTARFAESNPTLFKFTAIVGGVATALGPVIFGLGQIAKVAGQAIGVVLRFAKAFDIAGLLRSVVPIIMHVGRALLVLVNAHPMIAALTAAVTGAFLVWKNWDKIEPILRDLYNGVKTWLKDKLGAVMDWVGKKVDQVTGFFKNMYVAVVGNSYVPDMVDGIAAHFARLDAAMVDPADRAARSVEERMRDMASDVRSLLDGLFPDIAAMMRRDADLSLLDDAAEKGLIDDALRRRARLRVLAGGRDRAEVSEGLLNTGPLAEAYKVREAAEKVGEAMAGLGDRTAVQTVRIAETFQQMTDRALGSLRQLVEGIRGGGFLGILEGLIGLGTTLGSAGVFGKGFQNYLRSVPGFANGGMMQLGGMAGIDRNVLSLNGSPIARVSAGETMQIRPANDRGAGGALHVTVTMDESTGALGAFVRNAAGQVVAQAAPVIARSGADMAIGRISRAQDRMLA